MLPRFSIRIDYLTAH